MNVLLIIKDNAGRVLAETILSSGVSTIGRDAACTISVPHRSLSRHHAQITVNDNFVRVVDLGSRNGLYFGGERHQQIEFQENRRLDVGALNLEFQFMDQDHADVEPEQTSPGAQPPPEAEVDVRTQVGQAAKSTHESAFLARETFVGASPLAPRTAPPSRPTAPTQSSHPISASAPPMARPTAQPATPISNPRSQNDDEFALDLNAVGQSVAPSAQAAATVQPPPAPVDSPYFAAPVPPTQAVAPLPPLAPPPARPSAGTVTSYTVSKSGYETSDEAPAKAKLDLHSRSTQVIAVAIIVVITFIGLRWGTSGSKPPVPGTQSSTSTPTASGTTDQLDQASLIPVTSTGSDSPTVGSQDRLRPDAETRPNNSPTSRDVTPSSAQNSRPASEGPPQSDGSYRYGTANEYLRHVQDFVNRPR